jgi:hypothetical protein
MQALKELEEQEFEEQELQEQELEERKSQRQRQWFAFGQPRRVLLEAPLLVGFDFVRVGGKRLGLFPLFFCSRRSCGDGAAEERPAR